MLLVLVGFAHGPTLLFEGIDIVYNEVSYMLLNLYSFIGLLCLPTTTTTVRSPG